MGRELNRIGAPFRQPEWSALALMQAPDFVTRVHQSFIDAGADVITTNSYAVVPFHIGDEEFAKRGADLIALSGKLARDVVNNAGRHVLVAGSIPPVMGSYRPDLFDVDAARPMITAMIENLESYVDIWLAETISSLVEARLILQILSERKNTKPVWIAFTIFDHGADATAPEKAMLRSREGVGQVVQSISNDAQISAILFNCSQPEEMTAAVTRAGQVLGNNKDIAIGAYANAFPAVPEDAEANAGITEERVEITPGRYREFCAEWVDAGAIIIGGCCGIGPDHISELARHFKN